MTDAEFMDSCAITAMKQMIDNQSIGNGCATNKHREMIAYSSFNLAMEMLKVRKYLTGEEPKPF